MVEHPEEHYNMRLLVGLLVLLEVGLHVASCTLAVLADAEIKFSSKMEILTRKYFLIKIVNSHSWL